MKKKKFDCYSCRYQGDVANSAHICCEHLFPKNIKGDSHGIKNGWFCFPFNFDPVWLENCDSCEKLK